jgi:hypothetical protein
MRDDSTTQDMVLLGATLFLACMLFFSNFTADLPALREMRGFIYYGGFLGGYSLWPEIAHPVGGIGAPSRMVAMLFSALDARICGFGARCNNLSQALLLASIAVALFVHLTQLLANRWVAAWLAALWCLSLPALEGSIWQATQLDKLAALFSLLYLIVLHRIPRHGGRWPWRLGCNVLLVVLLFLAFKSKEIAFVLVPLTVLWVLIESVPRPAAIFSLSACVLLPVAYGTYYIVHYMQHVPADMARHFGAGSPLTVLPILIGSLLGNGPLLGLGDWGGLYQGFAAAAATMMTLVLVLSVVRFVYARHRDGAWMGRSSRTTTYLGAIVIGTLLMTARTEAPHAYYLMITEGALLGLIGLAALEPGPNLAPRRQTGMRIGLIAATSAAVAFGFAAQRTPGSAAARIQTMGRILNDAFATIRTSVPAASVQAAEFVFTAPIDDDWYFFGDIHNDGRPDPEMMSFVYRKPMPVTVTNYYAAQQPADPPTEGTLRVLWNADGSIDKILFGSRTVLDPPRMPKTD